MTAPRLVSFVFLLSLFLQLPSHALPAWSYDAGPDPKSKMGKELIEINADIPFMPGISYSVMGKQKFRPAFGPVPWRMRLGQGNVKILFIGQDATHIAEAAGRPATAGFGGRAQDLARYFGVNESAAFINTYAFTINGQYGAFKSPFILIDDNGKASLRMGSFVDNGLWLITQDQDSPITKWRNRLIDWIVRNNRETLRLIVLFGGAARDAAGSFMVSKGAKIETNWAPASAAKYQVPETKLEYAGANNEFPVLLNEKGEDLFAATLGREMDYAPNREGATPDQDAANDLLENNLQELSEQMVFTKGGPLENGMIHVGQAGGYNLSKDEGKTALSLNGLTLSDGKKITNDNILVTSLPHPSALSRLDKTKASETVARDLKKLAAYVKKGWKIQADPGLTNSFAAGKPYEYARSGIGPEYYDFGTPATRMVAVSTASRMSKKPHVIVFGTRESGVKFDQERIDEVTGSEPAEPIDPSEMYVGRPRGLGIRSSFDPGPGETYAKLMKENLDLKKIFTPKTGMTWKDNGIAAFNVKSHPDLADFGHYRGSFTNARVLVLADPDGYDDIITSRALTGERGQYLNGLLRDMGVGPDYLVIKTVPFAMDGASDEEWSVVLAQTKTYRKKLVDAVLKLGLTKLILADGVRAAAEMKTLIGKSKIPVIAIERGEKKDAGLMDAAKKIAAIKEFKAASKADGRRTNIPRTHLPYYARVWEGTSGDRVLNSTDKFQGLGFAVVAPEWAFKQRPQMPNEKDGVEKLIQKLKDNNLPMPGESMPDYLKRRRNSSSRPLSETLAA